jgi:ketosteroid isomerase-like protein
VRAQREEAAVEPKKVVETLWERIQARDWQGVGDLLADDVVVDWPASAERIEGRENFVAINSEYPEGWTIRVLRIVAEDDDVVSEVEVPHEHMGVFRAASFWTVRDGKVVGGREYWTSLGAETPPEWRAGYIQRL